ncbi:MAG: hydrolase [Paenibacillaceae bacterium ZCTH02-B3]|nr:MAG: hydrolase [Paenibacillaceae bacterium ZCTH02-B3]
MYKLVASDIDDTLLHDDLTISERNRQAIHAAAERGVVITLATGRMFPSAQKVARSLQLNVPLITYQGSKVRNLLDEQTLYERSVPPEIAAEVFRYAEKHKLHLQVYHDDVLYVLEDNEKIRRYAKVQNVDYRVVKDFSRFRGQPLTKMLVIDAPDALGEIAAEWRNLFGDRAYITKSKPEYLELLHPEGTKGSALKFLASHYGIDMSEVIALGDSWNDHDMIEIAGLGVAMGNAVDTLKAIADYIAPTNNEDGVAHVIEKFVLRNRT